MTLRRFVFFGLLSALFITLWCTGHRVCLWAVIVMSSVLLMAALNILYSFFALSFRQYVTPQSVLRGERSRLCLEFKNASFLPFCHIRATYITLDEDGSPSEDVAWITPNPLGTSKLEIPVDCPYRGEYLVGVEYIRLFDVFGLLSLSVRVAHREGAARPCLLVFPRVTRLSGSDRFFNLERARSENILARQGEPDSIVNIREYRQGDLVKLVHWKLSARKRTMLVREYDNLSQINNVLLLDLRDTGLDPRLSRPVEEMMCECAASITRQALDRMRPIRMIGYTRRGKLDMEGRVPGAFQAFHSILAKVAFDGSFSPEGILSNEFGRGYTGTMTIITRSLSGALSSKALELASRRVSVLVVLVEDSADAPLRDAAEMNRIELASIRIVTVRPGQNLTFSLGGAL